MLTPLFRAQASKASVTATGFSAPMGARVLRKILRYGEDGGVRFKCFVSAHRQIVTRKKTPRESGWTSVSLEVEEVELTSLRAQAQGETTEAMEIWKRLR